MTDKKFPPVIDPDNVPETLCHGQFQISMAGPLTTITFTHNRLNVSESFATGEMNDACAVVRARIVINSAQLEDLRNIIDQTIQKLSELQEPLPPQNQKLQ